MLKLNTDNKIHTHTHTNVTILFFRVDSDGEFVRADKRDFGFLMRENVELLFGVVPHNEKLKMKGVID